MENREKYAKNIENEGAKNIKNRKNEKSKGIEKMG